MSASPTPQRLDWRDAVRPAGLLTLSRLPIAVVYPFVAGRESVALGLYLLAAATDLLDGWVARRTGTTSHTGAVLDGWIDKILYVNIAWTLVLLHDVPGWWMLCWFARELIQGVFVPVLVPLYYRGLPEPRASTALGKLTTWLVGISLVASLLDVWWVGAVLTPLAGLSGTAASVEYLRRELIQARHSLRSDAPATGPTIDHQDTP